VRPKQIQLPTDSASTAIHDVFAAPIAKIHLNAQRSELGLTRPTSGKFVILKPKDKADDFGKSRFHAEPNQQFFGEGYAFLCVDNRGRDSSPWGANLIVDDRDFKKYYDGWDPMVAESASPIGFAYFDRCEDEAQTSHQAARSLQNDVARASKLPADWPGEPVDETCLRRALRIADVIQNFLWTYHPEVPLPYVSPTTIGGIVFEWFGKGTDGREFILAVEPEETALLMTDASGHEREVQLAEISHLTSHLRWLATGYSGNYGA